MSTLKNRIQVYHSLYNDTLTFAYSGLQQNQLRIIELLLRGQEREMRAAMPGYINYIFYSESKL